MKIQEPESSAQKEITYEESKLMLVLVIMIIPFYLGGNFLFNAVWEDKEPLITIEVPGWIIITSVVLAVIIHELIHGAIFAFYAPNGFRAVTFGFSKAMWSPYCHCTDPIKVKHYRRAGIAPFIMLGLVPYGFALLTGVSWVKTFGLLLCVGGFGDLVVWIKLLKFDSHIVIRDHPKKMGFIIEEQPTF